MATIKVNMDSTTPWSIAEKLAAQWSNQQSAAEAGVRRLKEGDLDGSYDEDTTQKDALERLKLQQQGNLDYLGAQNAATRDRDQWLLDNGGTPGSRRYGASSSSLTGMNPNAAKFADGLAAGGVTNPNAIAAYLGHASVETGGTFNPRTSHDSGTGFGMLGWRDPEPGKGRWTGLKQFASSEGMDPADPYTQGMWAAKEAQTTESQYLGSKFLNAQSPQEAAQILLTSQRPKAGKENMPRRLADTANFARILQGQKPGSAAARGPSVAQQTYDDKKAEAAKSAPGATDPNNPSAVVGPDGLFTTPEGDKYRYIYHTDPTKLTFGSKIKPEDLVVDPTGPQAKNGALRYKWMVQRGKPADPTVVAAAQPPAVQTANGVAVPPPPKPVAALPDGADQQGAPAPAPNNGYGEE